MPKQTAQNPDPSLAELLALAMRHARVQGYSIAQVDRALAEAIAVEAMQRAAMLPAGTVDGAVAPDAAATVLDLVLTDVRDEAVRLLRMRVH